MAVGAMKLLVEGRLPPQRHSNPKSLGAVSMSLLGDTPAGEEERKKDDDGK